LPESAAIGYFTVIPSLRRLTDFVERRLFLMTKSLIKNGGRPARRRAGRDEKSAKSLAAIPRLCRCDQRQPLHKLSTT
jgi:hypothetical protein